MDDAELLTEVGHALWGTSWKGPLAEAVRHERNVVSGWASGRTPVPPGVWNELQELMRRRRHEFETLAPRIQRAHDAALRRTLEQARPGGRKGR